MITAFPRGVRIAKFVISDNNDKYIVFSDGSKNISCVHKNSKKEIYCIPIDSLTPCIMCVQYIGA